MLTRVVVLCAIGCGDRSSTTPPHDGDLDAGGSDADPIDAVVPNVTHHGIVQGVHFASGTSQLSAGFYDTPTGAPGCSWTFAGACSIAICPSTAGLVGVSAGAIAITIDQAGTTLAPDASSEYPFQSGRPLPPGTTVAFAAEGGIVGAFSTRTFVMPAPLVVTAPADAGTIDRTQPLSIAWTATAGRVFVGISQNLLGSPFPATFERAIRCNLDAAVGAAEIPIVIVEQLAAGEMASVIVAAQDQTSYEVGVHEVNARLLAVEAPLTLSVQ